MLLEVDEQASAGRERVTGEVVLDHQRILVDVDDDDPHGPRGQQRLIAGQRLPAVLHQVAKNSTIVTWPPSWARQT